MAILVSFKVRDAEGAVFSVPFYAGNAATHDDALAFALAMAATLDDIINGRVESYTITHNIAAIGVKGAPVEGSRVDSGATFSFRNAVGNAWSNYVPSFLSTKLVNGLIVSTDTEVVAYRDLVLAGGGTFVPTDENLLDLTALNWGKQATRDT